MSLPLSRETKLCLVLKTNTKFVYRFQTLKLNPVEYLRFINCYEKAKKKRMPWFSDTRLDIDCLSASQEGFLFANGSIWNSNLAFRNKSNYLLSRWCFNRYLSVLLLFSIISSSLIFSYVYSLQCFYKLQLAIIKFQA